MATNLPKLTDIDPTTLFESFNVSDVVEIHKKIYEQIESKNEDLRTMVGERYRDLILAADTISEMKLTSSRVGSNIQEIIESCVSLNDQQLLGFRSAEDSVLHRQKVRNQSSLFSTLIEIKILTITPEIIWSEIDNQNFFTAAQLFIFSRHICTGLKLTSQSNEILNTFPVAKKQWDVLNSFFFVIKRSCYKRLESKRLSQEMAINCLASLMILENCNLNTILQNFIQLRGKAFFKCLCDQDVTDSIDDGPAAKVKDKILESINILNETVQLTYECFIKNEVVNMLSTLVEDKSKPTVSLIESELDKEMIGHLSDIITKFYPKPNLEPLRDETIKHTMNTWQSNIENVGQNQLRAVIDHITSIKTIHAIRNSAINKDKPSNWTEICTSLHLPQSLDIYSTFYKPLITNCVKNIIEKSWDTAVTQTKTAIEKNIVNSDEKHLKNFYKFVWNEDSGDLPTSLKDALNRERENRLLLSKTDGYIPVIVDICVELDQRLGILYEDFTIFISNDHDRKVTVAHTAGDNVKDEMEMIRYFKETCCNQISDLIGGIKMIKVSNSTADCHHYQILLAKTLQGFSKLCPNLRQCCTFNVRYGGDKTDTNYWERIRALLEEESIRFWKLWIDEFKIETHYLSADVDLNFVLKDLPNWEIQKIVENDEQQNPIETKIRIPSQPSFFLQQFLHSICQVLNQTSPHTIPSTVIAHFIEKILTSLMKFYKDLTEIQFVKANQNTVLQFYFDIKFLGSILVPRNNPKIADELKKMLEVLKSFIDPFDFELFYKYLSENIKKCGIGMQNQLGTLISNNEQLASMFEGVKTSTHQSNRDPNILALSSNANCSVWFPLLPIVNLSGGATSITDTTITSQIDVVDDAKTKSARQSTPTLKSSSSSSSLSSATQNYASNVKSGAAALFGAMSQEWFKSN